ncbi:uncharacterized protein LOC141627805 [Silene latifolia]|uniref:uncharacterized protein LOC141627805 n=1 Tax=Silene latifolia TaxID=37657 RepID=UPI003D77DF48
MTAGSCNKKRKRDCSTEESTGSNYSPNQLPSKMKLPIKCYIKLLQELGRARYMQNPYDNRELTWEDNELWEMVMHSAKVQNLPVEQFRADVKMLHETLLGLVSPSYEVVQTDQLHQLNARVLSLFSPTLDRGPPEKRDIVQVTNKRSRRCELGSSLEDRGPPMEQLMEVAHGQSSVSATTSAQWNSNSQIPIPVTIVQAGGETYLSKLEKACLSLNLNDEQCFKVEEYFTKTGRAQSYSSASLNNITLKVERYVSLLHKNGVEHTKSIHPPPHDSNLHCYELVGGYGRD